MFKYKHNYLSFAYIVVCMIRIDLSYTIYYTTISVFFPMAFIGGSVPLFGFKFYIQQKTVWIANHSTTVKLERLCQFAMNKTTQKHVLLLHSFVTFLRS